MPRLLISATNKSSGKTTVTMGLCALLAERGLTVQPFKKGPDYIDPMWLSSAAGNPCINLDFHTMTPEEIVSVFSRFSEPSSIAVVEGNKGLYDGVNVDGSNSSAALAKLLKAPVVLVVNAYGITRGIAPLVKGYLDFDREIDIAGIIINNVASERHCEKLRAALEYYTDANIVGVMQRDPELSISERHLGLIPSNEFNEARKIINRIAQSVASQINVDALLELAEARSLALPPQSDEGLCSAKTAVRIGIARDEVFGFYYPDDLESLQNAGAKLIYFDTLRDHSLPDVDGLFIGGGFPEEHLVPLNRNRELRSQILSFINDGGPVYAECGGLMYLSRTISYQDSRVEMVGAVPADAIMDSKPSGRGYVFLQENQRHPWPGLPTADSTSPIPAHEFHYSRLENIGSEIEYAYDMVRGYGIDGLHDGLSYKNLLASYSHLRAVGDNRWTERFVEHIRSGASRTSTANAGFRPIKQSYA